MLSYAPSSHKESNESWLNDLVGDIINPVNRVEGRTRARSPNRDLADTPRSAIESPCGWRHTSSQSPGNPTTPSSETSSRSLSFNQYSHYSYYSTTARKIHPASPLATSPSDTLYSEPISENEGLLSFNPFHKRHRHLNSDSTCDAGSISATTPSPEPPSGRQLKKPDFGRIGHTVTAYGSPRPNPTPRITLYPPQARQLPLPDKPRRVLGISDDELRNVRQAPPKSEQQYRTSLGRTLSQKRMSALLHSTPCVSDLPKVTEFGEFAPHPAVRPVNYDGEPAGDVTSLKLEGGQEYPGAFACAAIIFGLCLSIFSLSVNRNIVATITPQIATAFPSQTNIGWLGNVYSFTACAFQPFYGHIYKHFEAKWVFLIALVIFEIGSLLSALSSISVILILGRAVQGLGSAGVLTGSFVITTHIIPLERRAVWLALLSGLCGAGILAGPLLGAVLTSYLGWRWAFWINLPPASATFVIILMCFRTRSNGFNGTIPGWVRRIIQLDLIGTTVFAGACAMLFLGLQYAEASVSWNTTAIVGLLSGSGGGFVVFVAWMMYRGGEALVPLRVVRQRLVAVSCGSTFFSFAALVLHACYLPVWFQIVKGYSTVNSSVDMIPYLLGTIVFSSAAGFAITKTGLLAPPTITGTLIGAIGCGLIANMHADTSTGVWIGTEILISAGMGMAIQQGFVITGTALLSDDVSIGVAMVALSQSLGGAIATSVSKIVAQHYLLKQIDNGLFPDVDTQVMSNFGQAAFRSKLSEDSMISLTNIYSKILRSVFMAAIPLIGCAFLCSLCVGWRTSKMGRKTARKIYI